MKRKARAFEPGRHRRGTEARLVAGGFLVLLAVGGTLVWLLYGRAAALTMAGCLLATGGLAGLLWLILALLERWVDDA